MWASSYPIVREQGLSSRFQVPEFDFIDWDRSFYLGDGYWRFAINTDFQVFENPPPITWDAYRNEESPEQAFTAQTIRLVTIAAWSTIDLPNVGTDLTLARKLMSVATINQSWRNAVTEAFVAARNRIVEQHQNQCIHGYRLWKFDNWIDLNQALELGGFWNDGDTDDPIAMCGCNHYVVSGMYKSEALFRQGFVSSIEYPPFSVLEATGRIPTSYNDGSVVIRILTMESEDSRVFYCEGCGEMVYNSDYRAGGPDESWDCYPCRSRISCAECGTNLNRARNYHFHEDSWGDTWYLCAGCVSGSEYYMEDDSCSCAECQQPRIGLIDPEERSEEATVMNYSYKPRPVFFHKGSDNYDPVPGKLYLGMEIEMENENSSWVRRWGKHVPQGFVYLKSDSSLRYGVEAVTHPFELPFLAESEVPEMVDTFMDEFGGIRRSDNAGTHIHINKSAFSPEHLWKFLAFHVDQHIFLGKLGGRGSVNYANWTYFPRDKQRLLDVARAKSWVYGTSAERSAAVNLQPDHTIECRYPGAVGTGADVLQRAQLIHSVVTYTKECTAEEIKSGAFQKPDHYIQFLHAENQTYPQLIESLEDIELVDELYVPTFTNEDRQI